MNKLRFLFVMGLVSLLTISCELFVLTIEPVTHMITYDANGADSGAPPSVQIKDRNVPILIASNDWSLVRDGYVFDGWNTMPDGSGLDYAPGSSYNTDADLYLFAKWTLILDTFTVTYNGNGAVEGTVPSSQTKFEDVPLTILGNPGGLHIPGYFFTVWNTAPDGSGTDYWDGATYSDNADLILYAQWFLNTAKDISYYAFLAEDNASLDEDVYGVISGTNITLDVPYDADITDLVADFSYSGVEISVDGVLQVPSVSSNNFNAPVSYLIYAQDGSSLTYEVTVNQNQMTREELAELIASGADVSQADVSGITDLSALFSDNNSFNQDISAWDVSNVTNMAYLFQNATAFNQDISSWDTSEVLDMSAMFNGASLFNQDISGWDTSKVMSMELMFQGAEMFNQELGQWNTSSVTAMSSMFSGATAFSGNISAWDTANVTDMSYMFRDCPAFNADLSQWDTSNVTLMYYLFLGCTSFDQDISAWDTSNVTNMGSMFYRATAFNQDIGGWDVSQVEYMDYMFHGAETFNQDLSLWDVSQVQSMERMFLEATAFNGNISTWNVSTVTRMDWMFNNALVFNQDLGSWDVSKVTTMRNMFIEADAFDQDLSSWNTSSVTDMRGMFSGADLFNQDISSWDVSSVTDMSNMFAIAAAFNQDLSSWSEHVEESILHDGFSGSTSPLLTQFHPYDSWQD